MKYVTNVVAKLLEFTKKVQKQRPIRKRWKWKQRSFRNGKNVTLIIIYHHLLNFPT